MDNSKKKCKVVMLATKDYNNGIITKSGTQGIDTIWKNPKNYNQDYGHTSQHLYILSDEPIKEGDWSIHTNNQGSKFLFRVVEITDGLLYNEDGAFFHPNHCKKIIATTDPLLSQQDDEYTKFKNLPQPSQQFIEKYITEYNKGNIIEDVLVEYELNKYPDIHGVERDLKVNSRDNTITISRVKDSWNREEVIKLLGEVQRETLSYHDMYYNRPELLNKWIEENL